jgi:hypothetical protein
LHYFSDIIITVSANSGNTNRDFRVDSASFYFHSFRKRMLVISNLVATKASSAVEPSTEAAGRAKKAKRAAVREHMDATRMTGVLPQALTRFPPNVNSKPPEQSINAWRILYI